LGNAILRLQVRFTHRAVWRTQSPDLPEAVSAPSAAHTRGLRHRHALNRRCGPGAPLDHLLAVSPMLAASPEAIGRVTGRDVDRFGVATDAASLLLEPVFAPDGGRVYAGLAVAAATVSLASRHTAGWRWGSLRGAATGL
jgi:hypothetical protein